MNYLIFLVEERYVKSKFPKPPRFPQYPAGSEILCIFSNQVDNNEQDTQKGERRKG